MDSEEQQNGFLKFLRVPKNTNDLQQSKRYKQLISGILYFTYVAFGMGAAMMGPALLDLGELYQSDTDMVSQAFTYQSLAYFVGSILCGYLFSKLNRQNCFAAALFISGLTRVAIVYTTSLEWFYVFQVINGITGTGIDIAANSWLLEMWSTQAGPYMQALHFSFAFGGILGPITVRPFLSKNVTLADHTIQQVPTRIEIPFVLAGGFLFASALLTVILYLIAPYRELKERRSSQVKGTTSTVAQLENANDNPEKRTLILSDRGIFWLSLALVSVVFSFCVGSEQNTLNFLTTFIEAKGFGKVTGVDINTAYLASFTAGRGAGILLSLFISNVKLLYVSITLIGLSNILSMIFMDSGVSWLWISISILGLGQSVTFPATFSYVEENLTVTTRISGLFCFVSVFLSAISPLIMGKLIDTFPNVFLIFNFICFLVTSCFFVTLHFLFSYKSGAHKRWLIYRTIKRLTSDN